MATTTGIVGVVVAIAGLGVTAQVLADRLQVPSVLFLLLTGVLVGPEALGIVTPSVFGDALPAIVGLSVAIIVFEGAFHLRLERIRQAPRDTLRLVTIGSVVTLVGTAIAVRYALDVPWSVSVLVGSLVLATGPTVISPIVDVVPVRERVASTLETEGVVKDVLAAILAVVTFEFVVLAEGQVARAVVEFVFRLGTGATVGAGVAVLVWYLLRHTELTAESAQQNARLLVLVAALASYGIAEQVAPEAGIAAAAAGGVVLGNTELPHRDAVASFKGDVTLLVLSFVFITLASLLSIEDLLALGIGGPIVVAVVVLVLRPLAVGLSTLGGPLSGRERLFVSAVGPRGIIPASVATLFALELHSRAADLRAQAADSAANGALLEEAAALATAADVLVGTVFLVVFATVVFQGGFARHIAQFLNVIPMRVLIVGSGRVGRALAERLEGRDEEVVLLDVDDRAVERARDDGFTVRRGDATNREVLAKAGAENARVVAATTSNDDVNLLVAQLARNAFGTETVVARVNEPDNVDAFEDLDVDVIPAGMSIAWSMDNHIERPSIARWMTELDRTGDVQEIEVTASSVVGDTVGSLTEDLPDDVHLALVTRDGDSLLPATDTRLEHGDHITFIGRREAVREAIGYCHPD
ncbi:cation:proton antiporter [Halobacteriales archaeon Cl-PHB]